MAQTKEGAVKSSAAAAGLTLQEYEAKVSQGLKRCIKCREWLLQDMFGSDSSRYDGLAARCLQCRKAMYTASYVKKGKPARYGPLPAPARDGDKIQARQRINVLVRTKKIPSPNTLPCFDCGHVCGDGKRHQYDHYLGYSAANHYDVQATCTTCHTQREIKRGTFGGFGVPKP